MLEIVKVKPQTILDILDTRQLPVLSPCATSLLNELSNEAITFPELASILERYPTIAARILALANSAWSSPIEPVFSLEKACSRIGFSVVKTTSIALAVGSIFSNSSCPAFDIPRFWCRAMMTAEISSLLASASKLKINHEIARASGLLHSLGLLWLANQIPSETNLVLEKHQQFPEGSLGDLFVNEIGFDYGDAGALLAKEWGLPTTFSSAMEEHRHPQLYLENKASSCFVGHATEFAQALELELPERIPKTFPTALDIDAKEKSLLYTKLLPKFQKNLELAQSLF